MLCINSDIQLISSFDNCVSKRELYALVNVFIKERPPFGFRCWKNSHIKNQYWNSLSIFKDFKGFKHVRWKHIKVLFPIWKYVPKSTVNPLSVINVTRLGLNEFFWNVYSKAICNKLAKLGFYFDRKNTFKLDFLSWIQQYLFDTIQNPQDYSIFKVSRFSEFEYTGKLLCKKI